MGFDEEEKIEGDYYIQLVGHSDTWQVVENSKRVFVVGIGK